MKNKIINFNDYKYYNFIPAIIIVMQNNSNILLFQRNEIIDLVINELKIPQEQIERYSISNGINKIIHRIQWGVTYCKLLNYIESPQRKMWNLTKIGLEIKVNTLTYEFLRQEINKYNKLYRKIQLTNNKQNNNNKNEDIDNIKDTNIEDTWEDDLRNTLKNKMGDTNFELFCLELAKSLGVENAKHTGGKGDGGIDGEGLLVADDFISYKIGFQFKRYAPDNKITSAAIREFRGSLSVFDKGVFITSSYFTEDARVEARKDSKIRLIDFDNLCDLIIKSKLFVKPIQTYELNIDNLSRYIGIDKK
jgi:restriction system protein